MIFYGYYERRGLIPEPPRRESDYRQYSHETVERIRFIKHSLLHLNGHGTVADCPIIEALEHENGKFQ